MTAIERTEASEVTETANRKYDVTDVLRTIANGCASTTETRVAVAMSVDIVPAALMAHPDVYFRTWQIQPTLRRSIASTTKLLHPHPLSRSLLEHLLPELAAGIAAAVADRLRGGDNIDQRGAAELAARIASNGLGAIA